MSESSACNAHPPPGHPFFGTLVACYHPAEHVEVGMPHSWDIESILEQHSNLMRGLDTLNFHRPDRTIARIDAQGPTAMIAWDVDPETRKLSRPHALTELTGGPWLRVLYCDGEEYAIWKRTGHVYRVGPDGAVEDDPLPEAPL